MAFNYAFTDQSVLEVRIITEYQSSKLMNVLHYVMPEGTSPQPNGPNFVEAAANSFAQTGAGTLLQAMRPSVVAEVEFVRVEAQMIHPERWAKHTVTVNQPGLSAGTGSPSNLAATITKRADRVRKKGDTNHRGGTGTFHLAGFPLEALDGPYLTLDYITNNLALIALRLQGTTPVLGVNMVPVLWHRRATVAPYWDQVLTHTPENVARTMRRRGLFLGQ